MNSETKNIFQRWQSIENGDGLNKAIAMVWILRVIGVLLFGFVIHGILCNLDPVYLVGVAAITGWVTAETNALRRRLAQWPVFRKYIDWNLVQ